jgi:hypothetical protein
MSSLPWRLHGDSRTALLLLFLYTKLLHPDDVCILRKEFPGLPKLFRTGIAKTAHQHKIADVIGFTLVNINQRLLTCGPRTLQGPQLFVLGNLPLLGRACISAHDVYVLKFHNLQN